MKHREPGESVSSAIRYIGGLHRLRFRKARARLFARRQFFKQCRAGTVVPMGRGGHWSFLWERGSGAEGVRRGAVSWIHRHLDTSLASLSPVSERRSEFRYTVALPRGAQLVNTTSVETPANRGKEKVYCRGRKRETRVGDEKGKTERARE